MSKVKVGGMIVGMMMGLIQIQAQNLKIDDQLAIQQVVVQWNQLQDDGNINDFMKLWASDATFTNPFGTFTGQDGIRKFVDGYVAGFAKGKRHLSTNVSIKGSSNEATAVEDMMVLEVTEIPYLVATIRNNMILVKQNGSWKVKDVKLAIDPGFNKLMEKMKAGK
jgi:ketosteroid isomerase-like protein